MYSAGEQRITLSRIIDYYDERICPSSGREEREVQVCQQTIVAGFARSYYQRLTQSGMNEQAALRRVRQFFQNPPSWNRLNSDQNRILSGLFDRAALSAFSQPGNPATEEYEGENSHEEAYQTVLRRHRAIPDPIDVNARHPVVVQARPEQTPEERRTGFISNLRSYLDTRGGRDLLIETQGNRITFSLASDVGQDDARRMIASLNTSGARGYIASQLRQLVEAGGEIYFNEARIQDSTGNGQALHGAIISEIEVEIPSLPDTSLAEQEPVVEPPAPAPEPAPAVSTREPNGPFVPAAVQMLYGCQGDAACNQLIIDLAQAYGAYRNGAPANDHSCDQNIQEWMSNPADRPEMSYLLRETMMLVFNDYYGENGAEAALNAFMQGDALPRPEGIPASANEDPRVVRSTGPQPAPAPTPAPSEEDDQQVAQADEPEEVAVEPADENDEVAAAPDPVSEPDQVAPAAPTLDPEQDEEDEQHVRADWSVDLGFMLSLLGGTEINAPGGFGGFSEHYPIGLQILFRRQWSSGLFINMGLEYLYHVGLIQQDAEGNDAPRPGAFHDPALRFGMGYQFHPRDGDTQLGFSAHIAGRWLVSDDGIVSGTAGVQQISYGTLDVGATFEVTHPVSSRAYFFSSLRYSWSGFFEEELPGIEPGWINPISACEHRLQLSLGIRIDIGGASSADSNDSGGDEEAEE